MSLDELTEDQQEIRELAKRFADEKIAPNAGAWDRDHTFPKELFAELGELGLMGVCVPEEHGGAGADFLAYVLVLEELSRADAGVGVTVAVHTSAGTLPILNHGSDEQIEQIVPTLASGEQLAAFALTESGSGSDAERDAHARQRRPHHRRQAVDHQRLVRERLPRLRQGRRPPVRIPRPRRRRGLQRHPRGGEDGAQLELHRGSRVRVHARRAARRARQRHAGGAQNARRRPDRDRRARRSGSPRPRSTLRPATPRSATRSAARSRACRRSSRSSRTCRPRSRPPAPSSGAPRV